MQKPKDSERTKINMPEKKIELNSEKTNDAAKIANFPLKITAIITAAGKSERAELNKNKVLYPLCGEKTALEICAEPFDENERITEIIFTSSREDFCEIEKIAKKQKTPSFTVLGGDTRSLSVMAALEKASGDVVLIHDGARPFVTPKIINDCIEGVLNFGSAAACVPCVNSIADLNDDGNIIKCSRARKLSVQTPQGFFTQDILKAYSLAFSANANSKKKEFYTDESGVYSEFIRPVHPIDGDERNIKLTYPQDFVRAKEIIKELAATKERLLTLTGESPDENLRQKTELSELFGAFKGGFSAGENLRGGVGVDLHRLVAGRKLILGGVEIPHDKGLLGHSDADVLTHAVMDALLSAAALRDIGFYFSDKDEKYKDIYSITLLREVLKLLKSAGFKPHNVSAVIQAQKPKLSPFINKIRENLAKELGLSLDMIGVGCTTLEGLGTVGREEGIAATALCTIEKV